MRRNLLILFSALLCTSSLFAQFSGQTAEQKAEETAGAASKAEEAISDPLVFTIQTAVALALENNFSIQKSQQELLAAEKEMRRRWIVFFPTIDLSVRLGYTPDTGSTTAMQQATAEWNLTPTLSMALNLSIDLIARWRAVALQHDISKITIESLYHSVERDVKKLFYDLLLQKNTVQLTEDQLALSQDIYKQTESAYKSGLQDEYSFLRTELQVEQDASNLYRQKVLYKQLVNNFKFLIGVPVEEDIELEGNLDVKKEIINILLEADNNRISMRPDMRNLYKRLEVLENSKKLEGQKLAPRLSIGYTLQPRFSGDNLWSAQMFDSTQWESTQGTLFFNLSFSLNSIFPFSSVFTSRYTTKREIDKQHLLINETIEGVDITVRQLRNNILAGLELIQTNTVNLDIAERSYALVSSGYRNGLRTYDQLQTSEQSVRQAQITLLTEQHSILKNAVDLVYAINVAEQFPSLQE